MDEQEKLNKLTQLKLDAISHQLYGSRYLKKEDGTIVIRTPEGAELPVPTYEDYGDEL